MVGPLYKTVLNLLDRRDWAYVLGLLVPFAVYNLVLKAASVALQAGAGGFPEALRLMRSDLLFNAGYAMLWVGLFAAVRRGVLRKIVVVLFHAVSLLVVAITTIAYQYFEATGSTLRSEERRVGERV